MTGISTAAFGRLRSARALVLAGTALTAAFAPTMAHAQNIASNGSTAYTLTEAGTRYGGPRVVDIATSGGDIALDLGTIGSENSGNTLGAGVAANNTGSGDISIDVDAVTAIGTGQTYGIDARTASGNISIISGTVTSDANSTSRGIQALSANGNITINADVTNGAQRGIYTGTNNGIFPNITTITSNVATASGADNPNAIIGQGQTVNITSGTARNTNVNAATGTTIFANAGAGGAIVHAGTTEALGNNQAAIWAASDGIVQIDSEIANVTQTSYGINIKGATDLTIRSGTVNSSGSYGATGIYVSNILSSSNITSGLINTAGSESYGMWFDHAAGDIAIDSGTITTTGDNSAGINIAGASGTTKIISDSINTAGEYSYGMTVDSTGAVDIDSKSIITTGQYSEGLMIGSSGPLTIHSDTIAATGLISSAIYAHASGAIDVTSNHATSGDGSLGIYLSNRGTTGSLNLTSGDLHGAKNGIATYGQDATTVTSGTIVLSGTSTATSAGYGISARSANGAVSVTSGTIEGLANGASYGIDARTVGGNAATITSGSISAFGDGGFGIHGATEAGALTILSTGTITTTGTSATNLRDTGAVSPSTAPRETHGAQGIWATSTSGAVSITNGGTISTLGLGAEGILAQSTSGTVDIASGSVRTAGDNSAAISVTGGSGATTIASTTIETFGANSNGILVNGTGTVTVTSKDIHTAAGTGIAVSGGDISIATTGDTISNTRGAIVAGGRNVTVTTGAATNTVSSTGNAAAIQATGTGDVIITNGGTASAGGAAPALLASAAGLATIDSNVAVNNGTGAAIVATGANGAVIHSVDAASAGSTANILQASATTAGDVNVVSGSVHGSAVANAIFAVSNNGASSVTSAAVVNTNESANAYGIYANGKAGATILSGSVNAAGRAIRGQSALGNVSITTTGDVTSRGSNAISISGASFDVTTAAGTIVSSNGGSAAIAGGALAGNGRVVNNGSVSANGLAETAIGVTASGNVDIVSNIVTVNGSAAPTSGFQSAGISAVSNGGGNVVVTSESAIVHGPGRYGIVATTTGAGTIGVDSGIVSNDADGLAAIRAQSETGAITIVSDEATTSGMNAIAISAQSTTGAISITSGTVHTSAVGSQGVWGQTINGDILIHAGTTVTTATGYDGATGNTQDGVFGYSSGAGAVSVFSDYASVMGDYSNAVGASGGGAINITSGTAISGGFQTATVYGSSRNSDVTINSVDASATGINSYAVEGHANNGNLTINSGLATAQHGNAVYGVAGGLVTVAATTANAYGDGGTGVAVTGGTGVVLNVGTASSDGTIVTNAQTGITYRADAIFAQATNGTINATIGSASATGASSDAVHLIANGTGGAVTANITGTVSSSSGTGLWIDPPGAVSVSIGAKASVSGGTNGVNLTGGTNSLVNLGSISSTSGAAIVASGPTVLDNSGSIKGGNGAAAVQLGASNDTVILRSGSNVSGAIVGGGGTDAAVLAGMPGSSAPTALAAFTGFDSLTVQSGYWTAPTTVSSSFNRATIDGGASLELANGPQGISGITVSSIVDNGTLVVRSDANSGSTAFGAVTIGGTGGVRFTGTGMAVLDGNNSLQNSGVNMIDADAKVLVTGTEDGSFINNGVFQIGSGGTTGNFTGSLVDNGTLIVNRSDAYSFEGVLSGSGTFIKQGAGTISFSAGYAFTGTTQLEGGAIKLTGTVAATTELAVEGSGTVDFSGTSQTVAELSGTSNAASVNIAGGSLAVNQTSNSSFAGALTGNGSFTKEGSGTLTLSGTNTYTGPTSVNSGELAVNGSIVSPLTVNSGGTLSGSGSVGNTTIGSGGSWAPGSSASLQSVMANRAFSGQSALAIRAAAATPSFATQTVNGNATFTKGSVFSVDVDAAGNNDRISATGTATISGGTVQVLAGAGTYAPLTSYTILSAAGGVSGRFDTVTSNLAFLTPLLSYGANSIVLTLARNDVSLSAAAVTPNQLAVAGAVATRNLGDPIYNTVLVQSAQGARTAYDQLSGEIHASLTSDLIDGNRRVRGAILNHGLTNVDGIGMWAQALQVFARSGNQAGLAKLDTNRTGAIGGVDYSAGNVRIGVNGGYFDEDVTLAGHLSNATVKTKLAGASVSWTPVRSVSAQFGGTYAWHDIDTTRTIDVPGIGGTFRSGSKAHSSQLFGEVAYSVIDGPLTLSPFVRYARDMTRADALTEMGGGAALAVSRERRDTNSATLGFRFGGSAPVSASLSIEPRASVSYAHAWGDLSGSRTASFGGTGAGFAVTGARLGADNLDVDLGLDLVTNSGLRFGVGGFANASKEWGDYGAKASVSLRF